MTAALPDSESDAPAALTDGFGRRISYARLSVTDRCDLRCRYCMSERMEFMPRAELLSIEELETLALALIARGVTRIRLTGGEPLVRRGIVELVSAIGSRLGRGLDEVTMTTNGTQLTAVAPDLFAGGMRRVNVSLDSLDGARFRHITRRGDLGRVLAGIAAAKAVGMAVKINMVVMKGINDDEVEEMVAWCGGEGLGLTLIETMPLGQVEESRADRFVSLGAVKRRLGERWTLVPTLHRTGGPARYFDVAETGTRLGFITPLSNRFCADCNRIRITATGTIYGCLGRDQHVELRDAMREGGMPAIHRALDRVVAGKPLQHDFGIARARPAVERHMSVTGG